MRKPAKKMQPYVRRNPILKQATTTATIKVRLDARTVITVHDMTAFKLWLVKYPNATIMSGAEAATPVV